MSRNTGRGKQRSCIVGDEQHPAFVRSNSSSLMRSSAGRIGEIAGGSRVLVSDDPAGLGRAFCSELTAGVSSRGAPWDQSVILEEDHHPPSDSGRCFSKRFAFIIHLRSERRVFETERLIGGRFRKLSLLRGDLQFVPNGSETGERWREWREALVMAPADSLVMRTTLDLYGRERLEFRCENGVKDPQVLNIGLALKSEVESGCPAGRLYGESLALALVVHMLARYSVSRGNLPEHKGGMSPRLLKKVISFLHENLTSDLSLADLADCVSMNPYHFCRQFKKSFGVSPHKYLLGVRVKKAKQMLLTDDFTIAEISAALGFSHQSHFSEVFRRFTGMTPGRFRNVV